MKKLLQIAAWTGLLLLLSFTAGAPGQVSAKEFKDVPKSHPNYEAIQSMQKAGYINGYPDGSFRPNEKISRKHVAKLLNETLKLREPSAAKAFYSDVPKSHPYYTPIMKLSQAGIVSGSNGKFNPDAPITRIQMAKVLDLAFDFNMTAQHAFEDVYSSHWGYTHANALYSSGVAKGDEGKFLPNTAVTRAHYAEFLNRSIKAVQERPDTKAVTKEKAWDLSNRLPHLTEMTLIEGKRNKQSFNTIRPKLLAYATKEFTDGLLKDDYPNVCTECDSFLFPTLRFEPKIRFDFKQPAPETLHVQTIELWDGLAHGGFVDYKFKKESGKWKLDGYTYKMAGSKNFQLTADEAKKLLIESYMSNGARYVNVNYVSQRSDKDTDYFTKKPFTYTVYKFAVETDKGRENVEVHSSNGRYD
ncbi:S-layer homology domain-containing protein [Sporosarcina cascadiensis]|uniref:S-layer homology domain-containing protein n=1 Tax=Sporosarcina cascadiensis TaxID=2660747 RepID=UPI00129A48CC|nr:S-layer homology domain-containing protein [Sporosarcina cascadiensis]